MNSFFLLGLAAVVIFLIVRSLSNKDAPAEACARELIQLLRHNQEASVQDIVKVFQSHHRTKTDIGKVTRLIKPRLRQAHILKEDQPDIMQRVRLAKNFLPS